MTTATPFRSPPAVISARTPDGAPPADPSPRSAARIAGVGYVALFALAMFANFVVRLGLVAADDPAATMANLVEQEQLFRFGNAAFGIVFLIDVTVAWALYLLWRPAGAARALHAAWFRLIYTVFMGVGIVFLHLALQLATGATFADRLDPAEREAWTMLALELFNHTWLIGLAAFGVHLVLTGRLLRTSGAGSRLIGMVLMVAGGAYLFDTAANTLLPSYRDHEDVFLAIVAVPSIAAELAFTWWLLRRGFGTEAAR